VICHSLSFPISIIAVPPADCAEGRAAACHQESRPDPTVSSNHTNQVEQAKLRETPK
jgi:hypothetical protein